MSGEADRTAWADYWASAGADGVRPACLPNAQNGIEPAQRRVWAAFAQTLPRRARVLDIGTGDGVVLATLSARRDLELIGIDSAPTLPRAPRGIRLIANAGAEQMSFPDRHFDAVVSQFGYEYADTARSAAEVGRVLRNGGTVRMIVHHSGGPIVAHNRTRLSALRWSLGEATLLTRARGLVAARRVAALPTPDAFRGIVRDAQLRFGPSNGADELAQAVWQTLEAGRMRQEAEVVGMLDTLERRALAEILRVEGLLGAARDSEGMDDLSSEFAQAGVAIEPPVPLAEDGTGLPCAWVLSGRKMARRDQV